MIGRLISGSKEHPRIGLTKAELTLYLMEEMPDAVGKPPTTVAALTKFAMSAVESSVNVVKKCGEKILIRSIPKKSSSLFTIQFHFWEKSSKKLLQIVVRTNSARYAEVLGTASSWAI